ncbi:MAG: hypothetical protein JF618_01345 [Leifsonia sp.]|nr:hypothetical protein [Leifsonia sp.]
MSTWEMTWRLTVRWTATVLMSGFLGFAIWSAVVTPSSRDWSALLELGVGWAGSVLLTVGVTMAVLRSPRARRRG